MKRSISGFTIVELLIVIIVIAILAAISVVAYTGVQNRAKTSAGQSTANTVIKKLDIYYSLNGAYPTVTELRNNYAPGSTVASSGGVEARLDNPNMIVHAGLTSTSAVNGTIVQYNDCTTAHPTRSVVMWNYQTGVPVSVKTYETC